MNKQPTALPLFHQSNLTCGGIILHGMILHCCPEIKVHCPPLLYSTALCSYGIWCQRTITIQSWVRLKIEVLFLAMVGHSQANRYWANGIWRQRTIIIQSWVRLKIEVLFFAMVGPLTSEQITLSFGNSIIIAGVRTGTTTQPSLFYNAQLVTVGLKITLNLL